MKTYEVTIPIAGHITCEIKANSEQEAIKAAHNEDPDNGDLTWETLESFNTGNVCHCPLPWQIEVEGIDD